MKEKILALIENNSKLSAKDLAVMLDASEAEVAQAIAEMENDRVICGYHTIINWDATEKNDVTALIEVKVTPQRGQGFDRIAERIYKYPEVDDVYLMSGGFDLCVIMEGSNLKEVSKFVSEKLSAMDSVISTSTHFVLKKYKDHGTMINSKPDRERMIMTP